VREEAENEGCPIIYTDETYIHFSHTKEHACDDGTNAGLQQRWECNQCHMLGTDEFLLKI
jgi:hypothetical protein